MIGDAISHKYAGKVIVAISIAPSIGVGGKGFSDGSPNFNLSSPSFDKKILSILGR
jgi:hypothetical protein